MDVNERIAKVLGWQVRGHVGEPLWALLPDSTPLLPLPDFEDDIAACFRWLADYAMERDWFLQVSVNGKYSAWECMFIRPAEYGPSDNILLSALGAGPAEAIVAAFLAAFEEAHT